MYPRVRILREENDYSVEYVANKIDISILIVVINIVSISVNTKAAVEYAADSTSGVTYSRNTRVSYHYESNETIRYGTSYSKSRGFAYPGAYLETGTRIVFDNDYNDVQISFIGFDMSNIHYNGSAISPRLYDELVINTDTVSQGDEYIIPSVTGFSHFQIIYRGYNTSQNKGFMEIYPAYSITFDLNGHGNMPVSNSYIGGYNTHMVKPGFIGVNFDSVFYEKTIQPSSPYDENYIFEGWYNEPQCENRFSFGGQIFEDMTLYAKWIPKSQNDEPTQTPTLTMPTSPTANPSGNNNNDFYKIIQEYMNVLNQMNVEQGYGFDAINNPNQINNVYSMYLNDIQKKQEEYVIQLNEIYNGLIAQYTEVSNQYNLDLANMYANNPYTEYGRLEIQLQEQFDQQMADIKKLQLQYEEWYKLFYEQQGIYIELLNQLNSNAWSNAFN